MSVDIQQVQEGAAALKTIFDSVRSVIGLVRDARQSGKTEPADEKAIETALQDADRATKIAEAQIAQLLGYTLCRCQFPPTPMLRIGRAQGQYKNFDVVRCTTCGRDNAGQSTIIKP
ncbi:MAG TPA: hypothetical protein VL574_07905 [Stellaceae bacterium]|nr:hypothetical protein [Stellaceae bacterium]